MQGGDLMGFAKMLYTRDFYPDGSGNMEGKTSNAVLELPEESLDEATGRGIERAKLIKWA